MTLCNCVHILVEVYLSYNRDERVPVPRNKPVQVRHVIKDLIIVAFFPSNPVNLYAPYTSVA